MADTEEEFLPNALQSLDAALEEVFYADKALHRSLKHDLNQAGYALLKALQSAPSEARLLMLELVQERTQALRETCEMLARQTKEGLFFGK